MLSLPTVILVVVFAVAGCLLAAVYATIDDWRRDLTTNHAATDADATNPRLRPLEMSLAPAELAEEVIAAAGQLPGWRLESRAVEEASVELHFVRTTPLMRFKDDIHVRIVATPAGSRVTAESQSRVGKGDLGQNPRNIIELLDVVRVWRGANGLERRWR